MFLILYISTSFSFISGSDSCELYSISSSISSWSGFCSLSWNEMSGLFLQRFHNPMSENMWIFSKCIYLHFVDRYVVWENFSSKPAMKDVGEQLPNSVYGAWMYPSHAAGPAGRQNGSRDRGRAREDKEETRWHCNTLEQVLEHTAYTKTKPRSPNEHGCVPDYIPPVVRVPATTNERQYIFRE